MDAVGEAVSLGMNADFARTYTASDIGTQSVYNAVSDTLSYARNCIIEDGDWAAQAASCLDSVV